MASIVKDKRDLVGIILVLIGIVLIIDNITFIPNFIPWWIWSWQFLLVTIGVFSLLTSEKTGPGIILIGLGSIFLLSDILPDVWPGFFNIFSNTGNLFWYVVLIVIGISIIYKKRGERHHSEGHEKRWKHKDRFGSWESKIDEEIEIGESTDYIDEVAIFGGGKRIISTNNFKGGDIVTIFGGLDIIFSKCQLAPGIQVMEVVSMFGGWTLVVPSHWKVKIEVVSIFGSVTDKRLINEDAVKDNTSQLIIKGFVMFGGGEIKSY